MPTPIPARASKTQNYPVQDDDIEDIPDSYYDPRIPSSAIRRDTRGNQVIRQGNRQFVLHNTPPPRRKVHWSLILGIGMALMLGLYLGLSWVTNWWVNHQLDTTYGMPRTYQVDAVVGHEDSVVNPSHFIFLNLNGHIEIIELPGGNAAKAKIYVGPVLFLDNAALVPVTGSLRTSTALRKCWYISRTKRWSMSAMGQNLFPSRRVLCISWMIRSRRSMCIWLKRKKSRLPFCCRYSPPCCV